MHKTLFLLTLAASMQFSKTYSQTTDLGKLTKVNGSSPVYIAIGSSLSAGVRDGGVYAAAQQTSFPALLAQQMGINDFKLPILEGNGTGKKTVTSSKNGLLKFQEIKGLDDTNRDTKLPKVTTEVNNLAIPYQKVLSLALSEEDTKDWFPTFSKREFKHLDRLLENGNEKKQNYYKSLDARLKQIDFFTYELGMQDFIELFNFGTYLQDISFLTFDREGYFPEDEILQLLIRKGAKGVIANVPEVFKLPYYNTYTYDQLEENFGKQFFIQRYNKNDVRIAKKGDLFLPSKNITNILEGGSSQGLNIDNPIFDEDVIGVEERWSVRTYNEWLNYLAKKNNLPLVDLYALYEKILEGNYITDDGIPVNPKYPQGNFFSSDGLTPTSFGQAVITNEFIKVINSSYSSNIPLVATKLYLAK
ncbi:hypothetical protein GVN16_18140 [Emticicia sp. CRIBPO]|uniref:hypothetical protein n=1 Tax=Emticicia sp. CRIBPO TaxID=2683258 RepID=UPI001411DBE2|nr:hypothetical protein [Emticicia sp. CRIBPO]NBA87696.1 hypothetical protein [Emticicia sp. CRIBPO]